MTYPTAPWECWKTHFDAHVAAALANESLQVIAGAACRARKRLCSLSTAVASAASPVADGAGAAEVVVVRAAVVVVARAGVVVVRAGVVVVVRWYQGRPCLFSRANLARETLISPSGRSPTRTTTSVPEGAACTVRPDVIAETSTAMLRRSMLEERPRVAKGQAGRKKERSLSWPHPAACRWFAQLLLPRSGSCGRSKQARASARDRAVDDRTARRLAGGEQIPKKRFIALTAAPRTDAELNLRMHRHSQAAVRGSACWRTHRLNVWDRVVDNSGVRASRDEEPANDLKRLGQLKPAGLDLHAQISHDGAVDTGLHGAVSTASVRVCASRRQGLPLAPERLDDLIHDGPALAFVAGTANPPACRQLALKLELASIMKGERS